MSMRNFTHHARRINRNRRGVGAGSLAEAKPCRFCGRATHHASGFCAPCRADGFMAVFYVTGRDNGWSRKPREAVEIADGWRGRVVAGWRSGIKA